MKFPCFALAVAAAGFLTSLPAHADLKVVTSIKPIHSLVAGVMGDTGEASLLLEGTASPHAYSLKPSQARDLERADVVFWIGPELERFLEKPLKAIAGKATSVALMEASGVQHLDFREGGPFEGHDDHGHDEHGHKDKHDHDHEKHAHKKKHDHDHDHEKHAHKKKHDHDHDHDHEKHAKKKKHDHDHDHEKHAKKKHDHGHDEHKHEGHKHEGHKHEGHDHGGHEGHHHGEHDPHVWLDPENAKAMVDEIAHILGDVNPAGKATYKANADAMKKDLDALTTRVAARLAPVKDKGFIVFHDAFQYYEKRFGLTAVGAITVSPEVAPGAERLKTLRSRIGELGAVCVFAEPQFKPRVVNVITEGTSARSGVIDPLGASLMAGPDMYGQLLETMADSLHGCLSGTS